MSSVTSGRMSSPDFVRRYAGKGTWRHCRRRCMAGRVRCGLGAGLGALRPTTFTRWIRSPFRALALAARAGAGAAGKVSLSEVCSDGAPCYWLESARPTAVGWSSCAGDGRQGVVDLSTSRVSIRSRVHEYGGGACCLVPSPEPAVRLCGRRPNSACGCNGSRATRPRAVTRTAPTASAGRTGARGQCRRSVGGGGARGARRRWPRPHARRALSSHWAPVRRDSRGVDPR